MKASFLIATITSFLLISCSKDNAQELVAKQVELQRKETAQRERERKIEEDLREKEAKREKEVIERQEAQRKAPIRAGEFKISIIPDASVTSKFLVPVHVMTMSEGQAEIYRSINSENYWKSPNAAAQQIKFGTSGQSGAYNANVPFNPGDNAIVIITKIPGASQSETIIVRTLKRNDDLSTTPLRYSLTASGFRAL